MDQLAPTRPSTAATAGEAPTILAKYQLGRLLGRGSFAKVYHARSIADDAHFAVKIIDKMKTVDAAMEPRIIREVAAMRRLHHHPNILKIHEVMATKSKIYLVMEFASGGELFSKLRRCGRLNEASARRYFQQLVSAITFCHNNGVAHRDVKPQNLLLDKNGNLKVSDFGLSALPEQLKNGLLETACGTPAYTAPEVFKRGGYDGAKADAWSCGVILFVLLAGYLPFDDTNLITLYKKIQTREYKFPGWISKPARAIIYQLLEPNSNKRMSLDSIMKTSWFNKSLDTESKHGYSMFDNSAKEKTELALTAFDIISLSSGLDLSGLFEARKKKDRRFTSRVSMEGVVEKMRDVGERLGYRVERRKGGGAVVGLQKGRVSLVVEAVEMAEVAVVVEVKVKEGEGEEVDWEELKNGIEEIVVSWHHEVL